MKPYAPRPIRFLRVLRHADWTVKLYSIVYGGHEPDESRFEAGLHAALGALPAPAAGPGRPGVAFAILHRGDSCDYVVLAWWARENELPIRVLVREAGAATFRPARDSESVCVWDLEVIGFERDLYVRTVLADPPTDVAEYMAGTLDRARDEAAA